MLSFKNKIAGSFSTGLAQTEFGIDLKPISI